MLWSDLRITTFRENPAGVRSPGLQVLIRAGYLRLDAGDRHFSLLGERLLRRLAAIDWSAAGLSGIHRSSSGTWILPASGAPQTYVRRADSPLYQDLDLASAGPLPCSIPDPDGELDPEPFHTPGQKTIADVSTFTGLPPCSQIKTLMLVADTRPVMVLLRGDHALSAAKVQRLLGAGNLRPAEPEEIRAWLRASPGSLGPVGVPGGLELLTDRALEGRRNLICGANRDDYHLRHITPGKHFPARFHDLREVSAADPGIELTDAYRLDDPAQAMEALAGQHHDQDGLAWPELCAPFQVVLTPVNFNDEAARDTAHRLHQEIGPERALLDDRDERPGVKFKDADLIGIPWRVTIGKKLASGVIEILNRGSRTVTDVELAGASPFLERASRFPG